LIEKEQEMDRKMDDAKIEMTLALAEQAREF